MPTKSIPPFSYWLAFALGSVVLIVLFVFGLMAARHTAILLAPVAPYSEQATHDAWIAYVRTQVATMSTTTHTNEITLAKDGLLALRVTPQDKEAHLALVVALLALAKGDTAALARIQAITSSLH